MESLCIVCWQILLQGIVSLFITMYGVMTIAGEFREIRATVDLETKSWETMRNCPSFYSFLHRGQALSPNYIPSQDGSKALNKSSISQYSNN